MARLDWFSGNKFTNITYIKSTKDIKNIYAVTISKQLAR